MVHSMGQARTSLASSVGPSAHTITAIQMFSLEALNRYPDPFPLDPDHYLVTTETMHLLG